MPRRLMCWMGGIRTLVRGWKAQAAGAFPGNVPLVHQGLCLLAARPAPAGGVMSILQLRCYGNSAAVAEEALAPGGRPCAEADGGHDCIHASDERETSSRHRRDGLVWTETYDPCRLRCSFFFNDTEQCPGTCVIRRDRPGLLPHDLHCCGGHVIGSDSRHGCERDGKMGGRCFDRLVIPTRGAVT